MPFQGFDRPFAKYGGWFPRIAIGSKTPTVAPRFAPLHIEPTATPTGAKTAGDIWVDSTTKQLNLALSGSSTLAIGGDIVHRVSVPIATQAVDQWAFIAPRALTLVSALAIFTVTAGAAFTLDLKKASGTTAVASGTTMLASTFDLNTTANTLITGSLSATPANLALAANDRIGLDFTGTPTNIAGLLVQFTLRAA